jgi:predicted RNA binding protein YcfA (HicA-like mRNA interferase family)
MGDGFKFPSMKSAELKSILLNELGYSEPASKTAGSHNKLTSPGRKDVTWAFHNRELAPLEVKRVLLQTGLTLKEAKDLVRNR